MNDFTRTIHVEEREWVETALERFRPPGLPPRDRVQYAFADAASCIRFAKAEAKYRGHGEVEDWHLYEVRMSSPTQHPMCLVDQIYKWGEDDEDEEMVPLVREYWNPTQSWHRYEYLDTEMEVIERIPHPPDYGRDLFLSWQDLDLCKRLWPQLVARES